MYQFVTLKNPVPSCAIHGLKFEDGQWQFIYAIRTPFELKEGEEYDLVVYEYISDLYLKKRSSLNPQSVNISVTTLNGYMELIELQRQEDIRYRKEWCSKNPEIEPNIIQLENRDYDFKELKGILTYISGIKCIEQKSTIFTAV